MIKKILQTINIVIKAVVDIMVIWKKEETKKS